MAARRWRSSSAPGPRQAEIQLVDEREELSRLRLRHKNMQLARFTWDPKKKKNRNASAAMCHQRVAGGRGSLLLMHF